MKLEIYSGNINFDELSERLRLYIRHRINSGEFTERSLARIFSISQPHMHNMLKGLRRLSPDFADRAMLKFRLSVLDLISEEEIVDFLEERNPDWLVQEAARKPAGKTEERRRDEQAGRPIPGTGSGL